MKIRFTLLVLLFSAFAQAQNWQCLQSGVKHYFTNSNSYLRGIRIDSVKVSGDSTIYYPYHTPRGRYGMIVGASTYTLDTTGGSWLGKAVVQRADGTFIFDDIWQDSAVIRTQASVGDTWIFYKDTTSLYYEAALIAKDTMTISGTLDSVKEILITAHNSAGIVTTDPVDSFQIILSKNNGFVQVFDLYTFPYHAPDSAYLSGIDYYLDLSIAGAGNAFWGSPLAAAFSMSSSFSNLLFKIVNLINPTQQQLYNWNVGDVYEYSACNGFVEAPTVSCDPPQTYYLDSITGVSVSSGGTQYSYIGLISNNINATATTWFTPFYITDTSSGSCTYDNTLLLDTTLMPEECQPNYYVFSYYYSPHDTSYCLQSALYGIGSTWISGNTYVRPFENGPETYVYKMDLGLVHFNHVSLDIGDLVNDQTLIYSYRNGSGCGVYNPLNLGVKELTNNNTLSIYPNPATDEVTIQSSNIQPCTISIINMLGQTVKTTESNNNKVTISVGDVPAGIYNVCVTDNNGARINQKVVIVH